MCQSSRICRRINVPRPASIYVIGLIFWKVPTEPGQRERTTLNQIPRLHLPFGQIFCRCFYIISPDTGTYLFTTTLSALPVEGNMKCIKKSSNVYVHTCFKVCTKCFYFDDNITIHKLLASQRSFEVCSRNIMHNLHLCYFEEKVNN